MKTSDFDYSLPPELIAQTPLEPRDHSRLMILNRKDSSIEHRHFFEIIEYLHEGDVMVFNNSRVIPARLKGIRSGTGGKVEVLLIRRMATGEWEALVKPARRLQPGAVVEIPDNIELPENSNIKILGEITAMGDSGIRTIRFNDETSLFNIGEVPLPPYIHQPLDNPERYQTIYAKTNGSLAAPTAGLHFTPELLGEIGGKGVRCVFITLHVGMDTFRPVTEENPLEHTIYREFGEISKEVAGELSLARREGRRIIGVGTTVVRMLEKAASINEPTSLDPYQDWVDLFIMPGHRFRLVDAMITNFHLPKSTLLMLVSAFGGKDLIDKAYQEAIKRNYHFYSFGDAMLIV